MARPRDEGIDRAIIDACVELLGEVGRSHLTRQGVARRAGVSLPAVTRRYATIDDLILAVVSLPALAPRALPSPTAESYLVALLSRSVRVGRQPGPRRAAVELLAAAAGDARTARAFSSTVEALRSEALQVLDQARLRGELSANTDLGLVLDQLYGAIWYRQLWRQQQLTDDDLIVLVQATLAPYWNKH